MSTNDLHKSKGDCPTPTAPKKVTQAPAPVTPVNAAKKETSSSAPNKMTEEQCAKKVENDMKTAPAGSAVTSELLALQCCNTHVVPAGATADNCQQTVLGKLAGKSGGFKSVDAHRECLITQKRLDEWANWAIDRGAAQRACKKITGGLIGNPRWNGCCGSLKSAELCMNYKLGGKPHCISACTDIASKVKEREET